MTDERITIRLSKDIAEALKRFASDEANIIRSRQDAFRYIARDWLASHGYMTRRTGAADNRLALSSHRQPGTEPARCRVGDTLVLQCRVGMLQDEGRLGIELPGLLPRVSIAMHSDIEFSKGPGVRRRPTLDVGDFVAVRCEVLELLEWGSAKVGICGLPDPLTIQIPAGAEVVDRFAPWHGALEAPG